MVNENSIDLGFIQTQNDQNINSDITTCSEQVSLWQLNCPCPVCKVKCNEGTDRILCKTCHNWFHFECTNLSKTSFDKFMKNPNKTFLCKICKIKTSCTKCTSNLKLPRESIYCVGCLDKFCKSCLDLSIPQIHIICSSEKAYFCPECSVDHFCNVCKQLCVDGCIYCDNCHDWVHYRYTKLKKSQIISYAKTSKKYYCNLCVTHNVPFSNVSTLKLSSLNNSDRPLLNNLDLQIPSLQNNSMCNLCLECNPECTVCYDNTCVDPRRICDTCLICSYVLEKLNLILFSMNTPLNFKILYLLSISMPVVFQKTSNLSRV